MLWRMYLYVVWLLVGGRDPDITAIYATYTPHPYIKGVYSV